MHRPEPPPPHTPFSSSDVPAADLVRLALAEAKNLIALEVALAKDDARREVFAARRAGIAFATMMAALLLALALLLVALSLAIFPGPRPALIIGLSLAVLAVGCGVAGLRLLPQKPLERTRARLRADVVVVKEHVV